MAEKHSPLAHPGDVLSALGLLTRLPVPIISKPRGAEAAWAYPLAGLVVGGLAALAGLATLGLGLPAGLAALATLTIQIVATGALHEDGLADTADGFWGGWNRERRLDIMKDSHIGSYGVIALILSLGVRTVALWMLWEAGSAVAVAAILSAALLSRAAMPVLMASLPHARKTGLSHHVGRVTPTTAGLGCGIAVGLALLLLSGAAITAVLLAGLALAGMGLMAKSRIGGQTGDVLGATQQVTEITVLLTLLA